MEEILHIRVKDLWAEIKQITGDNPHVYNDDEYLKEHYPHAFVLKQLIKTYTP